MRCKRCLYDESVAGISFDSKGVCNYCHLHDQFDKEYPTDEKGKDELYKMFSKIRKEGEGKKYDVVVGVSGGCDSSYLLYITKLLGLRPLAVHWDNGWNTEIARNNMEAVTKALDVDYITVGVDKKEYDDICLSFLKSGVSDIDIANDIALTSVLYKAAEKFNIGSVFIGHSFRTEGIAPIGWTYMDGKYIESIQKKYGSVPLNTYPNLWLKDFIRYMGKIKRYRPLYYIDYVKEDAKKFLSENLGWKWYGGHHMENIYTSFQIAYFMPKRYGIDMRLLGHSGLIRSGQMKRSQGLKEIKKPMKFNPKPVIKRLGISQKQLNEFITQPKKTYKDFKTYKKTFKLLRPYLWLMYKLHRIPKSFYLKYTK